MCNIQVFHTCNACMPYMTHTTAKLIDVNEQNATWQEFYFSIKILLLVSCLVGIICLSTIAFQHNLYEVTSSVKKKFFTEYWCPATRILTCLSLYLGKGRTKGGRPLRTYIGPERKKIFTFSALLIPKSFSNWGGPVLVNQ